MQPRWEVIGKYPFSLYQVGDVIVGEYADLVRTPDCTYSQPTSDLLRYDKLFQQLDWWERRELADLPSYLKTHGGIVFETTYKMTHRLKRLSFQDPKGRWGLQGTLTYLIPATEEEYNVYKAKPEAE